MTVKELRAKLADVPEDAKVVVVWEDFAKSAIQATEFDENGEFVIYHDMTFEEDLIEYLTTKENRQ